MKFYLIVASGKMRGMPIPISVDLFTMGSDRVCQLRSRLDGIGGQHCALVTRDKKVFVRDLSSGQETVVNNDPLEPGTECPLHTGDKLRVGPLEFMIQFKEKLLSKRDAEEWALKCLDVDADAQEEDDPHRPKPQPDTAASAAASLLDHLRDVRGVVKGRLRIGHEHGITQIRFNDIYLVDEAELALVKRELLSNLKHPNQRVLLDFKNVSRLSSNAAAMLDEVYSVLMRQNCKLALCRLRSTLTPALAACGLMAKVRLFADKKMAMNESW